MLTEAAQASPALADKPTRSWHTTGAGRQGCRPGLTDQMCGPGFNQRAPPRPHSPRRVPRSSALSATPSQRPETCGESTCELATPSRPCLKRPTCPACDEMPPCTYLHTGSPCTYMHTHEHTHMHTHRTLEPEWRLRPRPCLLAPTKIGDHTCSGFCSQGEAGRWGWGEYCQARLLRSSPQTDRHANTRLKHM